jgi:hypothetical protein
MMKAYHQAKRVRRLWGTSRDTEGPKTIPAPVVERYLPDLIDAQLNFELLARLVAHSPDPRRELLATVNAEAKAIESYLNRVLKECRDASPADPSAGGIQVCNLKHLPGFLGDEFIVRVSDRIDVVLRAVERELRAESATKGLSPP